MQKKVIIGAGISGISAASHLKQPFIVLEKTSHCGGLAGQYQDDGYWFDHGGHYFHFKNRAAIRSYLEKFTVFRSYRRRSKIFLQNRLVPFPLQNHLSFLPRGLARTIINEIPRCPRFNAKNLGAYLRFNFGDQFYQLFFHPFLKKYYLRDPDNLMASMDKGSIPVPDRHTMIRGFEGKRFASEGYNAVFYYPGIPLREFIAKLAEPIKKNIKLNEAVISVDIEKKKVHTHSGDYEYDHLINTLPLNEFLRIARPSRLLPAIHCLEHVSTLVTNVVLARRRKHYHWVYLPERDLPFYRVGFYPNAEFPTCYLEKSIDPRDKIPQSRIETKEITFTLKKLGIIDTPKDIVYISQCFIPISYVIFNLQWRKTVPTLLKKLEKMDIYSIGRYGSWNYTSMSEDIQMAIRAAGKINQ